MWPTKEKATINLVDQSIAAFNVFLAWNTTGSIFCASRLPKITKDALPSVKFTEYAALWNTLLECYQLGYYLEAPNFNNAVADAMVDSLKEENNLVIENRSCGWLGTLSTQIQKVYDMTDEVSPLRKMVIDQVMAHPGASKRTANIRSEFGEPMAPLDFVEELLQSWENLSSEGHLYSPWQHSRCYYHIHPDGVDCGTDRRRREEEDDDDD